MELRGYDDYEVTLGDEIRGERASRGKSIADVERELHIKADMLLAIENCDLAAFPNPSVVAGYVRSYARYLRMDVDEFYRRFCAESGFVAPGNAFGVERGGPRGAVAATGRMLTGSPFDTSRFAAPPQRTRFAARVSLGSLASACALVGLVAGLGYGGWALLQNVQRVGFAPLPDAPTVVAEPPRISGIAVATAGANARLDAAAYTGSGALAAVFGQDDLPPVTRRDGPISAIDPGEAGIFAGAAPDVAPRVAEAEPEPLIDSADDAIRVAEARAARPDIAAEEAGATVERVALRDAEAEAVERGIAIRAVEPAWIRVRDDSRAVIYEGILPAGGRYDVPSRVARAELRAGNAGAVYIVVDGIAHGPIGRPGGVVKRVPVTREAVSSQFGAAGDFAARLRAVGPAERQAAADLPAD